MTTAISSVTPSLTPSQQAAREFWRQAGADGMPPFYVMSQYYAQLSTNSDNLPVVTAALDQLLTGLGYATDVDTVLSELTAGQGEELGYWAGRYCLFDSDGNRFDLVVGRNGATLTVPPALVNVMALSPGTDMASVTVLSSAGLSEGVLQLANAQFRASLNFALPVSDTDFDTADPAAAMFTSTAPQCSGTFGLVGGGAAGSRPVNGRRGAWTQAGINPQAADGDPAAAWYGQYVLLNMTEVAAVVQAGGADAATASVVQEPVPVYIYNDPTFGLTFQWGNVYGGNVTYNNNVLQCADEDDDTTQYAMQFVAPQSGAAEINLAVTTPGGVRSYKGYWVDRYTPPSPALQARPLKRQMTAVASASSGTSGGGYSQTIDVSSLTPGDKPTPIKLPYGAVGNNYALSLNLTGCAAPTDTFSWTLKPGSAKNDATSRAAVAGTNQTVLFSLDNLSASDQGKQLLVTVQLANTSASPPVTYTLQFNITVIQCDAISLAPRVLMPVVVGAAYTQNLVAHGAYDNFTWTDPNNDPNTSLPPGLTWDDSRHQLAGTVTDATQVGKAFNLVVGLAAPDVIMDPLTVSLGITVQSAPAVASDMPLWQRILLYAAGPSLVAMTAIIAFAIHRYKQAKANAKTAEAAQEGNKKINDATGEDPNAASKAIAAGDNNKVATIQRNLTYKESLINDINRLQTELRTKLSSNDAIISKMEDYLTHHPSDDPNDPVEDTTLFDTGYKTYGELEAGLPELQRVANTSKSELSTLTNTANQTQANMTADQNTISDNDSSDPNTQKLIEESDG
jgi:hypothetical protein